MCLITHPVKEFYAYHGTAEILRVRTGRSGKRAHRTPDGIPVNGRIASERIGRFA